MRLTALFALMLTATPALADGDASEGADLFKRCKAFMFAGAGLAQAVWDKLDAHGEAAVGERLRMVTGLGMTETAPACMFAVGTDTRSGHIGLPVPVAVQNLVLRDYCRRNNHDPRPHPQTRRS